MPRAPQDSREDHRDLLSLRDRPFGLTPVRYRNVAEQIAGALRQAITAAGRSLPPELRG